MFGCVDASSILGVAFAGSFGILRYSGDVSGEKNAQTCSTMFLNLHTYQSVGPWVCAINTSCVVIL